MVEGEAYIYLYVYPNPSLLLFLSTDLSMPKRRRPEVIQVIHSVLYTHSRCPRNNRGPENRPGTTVQTDYWHLVTTSKYRHKPNGAVSLTRKVVVIPHLKKIFE